MFWVYLKVNSTCCHSFVMCSGSTSIDDIQAGIETGEVLSDEVTEENSGEEGVDGDDELADGHVHGPDEPAGQPQGGDDAQQALTLGDLEVHI